ncbi:MAG: glycosyltransferase family 4 protein [Lachnospiraceae bacterium]|nr:glycosyltransferase family 4 protein [Lachnospiraceae bacterium]
MRILYLCEGKHDDIRYWSGTEYHIARMLSDMGNEMIYLDQVKGSFPVRAVCKAASKMTGRQYKAIREPWNMKAAARRICRFRQGKRYDLIFTTCTPLLAYLPVDCPRVIYTDTSFAGWLEYCRLFSPLAERSVRYGNIQEKMGLKSCRQIIYSSQWAKDMAAKAYGIPAERMAVVPFGANFVCDLTEEERERIYKDRLAAKEKRLLFVGFNWRNKGGERALDAVREMNRRGMRTKLLVVGCTPLIREQDRELVEIYGFLDKNKEEDKKKLRELYLRAHLFILPTWFDCTPIVLTEAASFGLPTLVTDTCGVSDMMVDGVSGKLMAYQAVGEDYAEKAMEMLKEGARYQKWCIDARQAYEEHFNWQKAGERIQGILEGIL